METQTKPVYVVYEFEKLVYVVYRQDLEGQESGGYGEEYFDNLNEALEYYNEYELPYNKMEGDFKLILEERLVQYESKEELSRFDQIFDVNHTFIDYHLIKFRIL
jgi:hypothetical protein